jgi:phage terminase large subunit
MKMLTDYRASVLFRRNYNIQSQIAINQGGTSSGKTYAIRQVLFCIACQNAGLVITVAEPVDRWKH